MEYEFYEILLQVSENDLHIPWNIDIFHGTLLRCLNICIDLSRIFKKPVFHGIYGAKMMFAFQNNEEKYSMDYLFKYAFGPKVWQH